MREYQIDNLDIGEGLMKDDDVVELSNNMINNIVKEEDSTGMCFNYALNNYKLEYCEESTAFVKKHYKPIPFTEVKKGDIVTFRDVLDDWYIHFAIVERKNRTINDTIITAKFGGLGVYEHRLGVTPTFYGDKILFWRKKK
jgi:hypothetical protein